MEDEKYSALKGALRRLLRVSVSVVLSGLVVYLTGQEEWLVLVPVLNAVGKYLRAQYDVPYMPI